MTNAKKNRALLVVGMTEAAVSLHREAADRALPFIQGELTYFRERGRPIFFGVPNGETVLEKIHPRLNESVVVQPSPNLFYDTALEEMLVKEQIGRVTLVGGVCTQDILLSAGGALARGYGLTVPEPCVFDMSVDKKSWCLELMLKHWKTNSENAPVRTDIERSDMFPVIPPREPEH